MMLLSAAAGLKDVLKDKSNDDPMSDVSGMYIASYVHSVSYKLLT